MLEGILSIAGQQGLFKLISKGKHNVIVESLITGKRMPAFATNRISTLEDVAIYTEDGDTPLQDIIINIYDKYQKEIPVNNKSNAVELAKFMEEVAPDYDTDRVYQSDIKKLISWYSQLIEYNIVNEETINAAKKEAEADNDNNDEETQE
jgi:hypothetical protein